MNGPSSSPLKTAFGATTISFLIEKYPITTVKE
jgi:hypothetical protein